jgi:hypothetical protein
MTLLTLFTRGEIECFAQKRRNRAEVFVVTDLCDVGDTNVALHDFDNERCASLAT